MHGVLSNIHNQIPLVCYITHALVLIDTLSNVLLDRQICQIHTTHFTAGVQR